MKTYKTIDAYIDHVPTPFLSKIKECRALLKKLIPAGQETIKYGMPTIQVNGKNLVHFAAMKGHLGFYPAPSGVCLVESELKKKGISFSKGCIRFIYTNPLPVTLITKIVKFRLKETKIV